uniref:Uncharacterized protein n=1 Tax=Candidatus Kentrum sp. DK TaxID=2126562 RepID=A0A450TPS2_9GAMM|nr:MAG: hypothetical protein BECKDK2373B_GA0170837_10206 [Candidatus Kentron sp. DK]VFJ69860.1 MAG: hypothetical protein BECKDK2373C_GA0170839_12342 [Candidatus Kentron sp. DK]
MQKSVLHPPCVKNWLKMLSNEVNSAFSPVFARLSGTIRIFAYGSQFYKLSGVTNHGRSSQK